MAVFGPEKTEIIIRGHLKGRTVRSIAKEVGTSQAKVNLCIARAKSGEDWAGHAALAQVTDELVETLTRASGELHGRVASMSAGELVAVIGGVLDQLRRAGVRFDLPAGSQDSTDSTSQSERSDSR